MLFIGTAIIPILFMLKAKYYDSVYLGPKKIIADKILKEKDEEARSILFYNRYFLK